MKRYRDPTPALQRAQPELPLREKVCCALIVVIAVIGIVFISVHLG